MSNDVREAAAAVLWEADQTKVPIAPLTETWPELDVVDAYEIQLLNIRRRLDAGAPGPRPQGRALLQGDAGDDGRRRARLRPPARRHGLLRGRHRRRWPASASPRVEVEVAFVLGRPLPGAGLHRGRRRPARRTTSLPAIELIDTPDPGLEDQVCDTDRRQRLVGRLRARRAADAADEVDLALIDAVLRQQRRDRRDRLQRRGARQPGDRGGLAGPQGGPVRRAAGAGSRRAARLVHRAIDARPGRRRRAADFDGLGYVSACFV